MSSNFFKQNIIETELKYIRLLNHKLHTAHVYNQSKGYTEYWIEFLTLL